MSKRIVQSFIFLLLTLFCIVLISVLNFQTQPLIAQTRIENKMAKLKSVINGVEFIPIIPDTLWQAFDSSKNCLGYVFKTWPRGYIGIIPITAGVDINGKITGVFIGSESEGFKETKGLGSKVRESAFLKQFIGKDKSQISLKKDGGEIDVISGATISSKAVCDGIKAGINKYEPLFYRDKPVDIKKEIFADADNFLEVIRDTLWYAIASNETLGIVFTGWTFGYLDTIKYIAGMNKMGGIEKIVITDSKETEGIGERIRESEFLEKFKSGMPDVISGATISSNALIKSVGENIERFKNYLK